MTIRVDGEIVSEQAVEFELARLVRFYTEHMSASEVSKQMDVLRKKAKDQAIGAKLLMKEADRLDIRVPPARVEESLKKMVSCC